MCGIVGYVGRRKSEPFLLEGLTRPECLGYDSAGFATLNGKLSVRKAVGRVAELQNLVKIEPLAGTPASATPVGRPTAKSVTVK